MTFRQVNRIFCKIFFSWIIVFFVFFLGYKYVNLEKPPVRDLIISDNSAALKKSISKNNEKETQDTTSNNVLIEKEKVVNKQKIESNKFNTNKSRDLEKEKEVFLNELYKQAIENTHSSPIDKDTHKRLCRYYKDYCSLLDLNHDFSLTENVYYSVITIYLLKFLHNIFPNLTENIYYIKLQKNENGRRGYAGHHTVVINIKDNMGYMEFMEVLTHELGHVIDLGFVVGSSLPKSTKFKEFGNISFYHDDPSLDFYSLSFLSEKVKKPEIYSKDFVSGYGASDIFEDFAECFNMYVHHNFVFIKMGKESNILKNKYNYINKLMKGRYLRSGKNFKYRYGYRPWDSTKMNN